MDKFLIAMLGGFVPAVMMLLFYFISVAGRLAKIETDISWLKKALNNCLPHLKDHSH